MFDNEPRHYKIEQHLNRLSIEGGQYFETLIEVRSSHFLGIYIFGVCIGQHFQHHITFTNDCIKVLQWVDESRGKREITELRQLGLRASQAS